MQDRYYRFIFEHTWWYLLKHSLPPNQTYIIGLNKQHFPQCNAGFINCNLSVTMTPASQSTLCTLASSSQIRPFTLPFDTSAVRALGVRAIEGFRRPERVRIDADLFIEWVWFVCLQAAPISCCKISRFVVDYCCLVKATEVQLLWHRVIKGGVAPAPSLGQRVLIALVM